MVVRLMPLVGQKVIIGKEVKPLTVREVKEETVSIDKRSVVLRRLYFVEKHQPEYDWRVKKILENTNE